LQLDSEGRHCFGSWVVKLECRQIVRKPETPQGAVAIDNSLWRSFTTTRVDCGQETRFIKMSARYYERALQAKSKYADVLQSISGIRDICRGFAWRAGSFDAGFENRRPTTI